MKNFKTATLSLIIVAFVFTLSITACRQQPTRGELRKYILENTAKNASDSSEVKVACLMMSTQNMLDCKTYLEARKLGIADILRPDVKTRIDSLKQRFPFLNK